MCPKKEILMIVGAMLCALRPTMCADSMRQNSTKSQTVQQMPLKPTERKSLPLTAVHIHDSFWSPKQRVYREKTIPHSWQYVQREIEDNEIAAGWRHETRGQDNPWNQANLHKVLETGAYALAQEPNPELEKKLDSIITAIAGAQQPNGYVNALITVRHMTPWTNLDGQHEGYVAGHMIEAAVAYYLATGKRTFLDVACKMADHIYQHFIVEKNEGVCGHAELELALVRLYQVTGERRYLALAQDWIERRGKPWHYSSETPRSYFMDHLPIRQVPEVTGHAVRSMFYLTGVANVAAETGDAGLKAAAERLWLDTTHRKMYVTGSVGSQEKDEGFGPDYDLPNNGYAESCAACGLLYFAHGMFMLNGNAENIDVLERVLYNAVLHGMALDGTTSYYRNPLTDENNPRYNIWICCPPCLSRTLLRVQDYIYARTKQDIYVNLYVGSTATVPLENGAVTLSQKTNYPWDGHIKLSVNPPRPNKFRLLLRIPGWCQGATLMVNHKPVSKLVMEKGYAVLSRQWHPNDSVELDLPMPVQRVEANPQVKADNGLVALQRGPIVYGLEGLDNAGHVDVTLPRDPQFQVEYRPDFLGSVPVITGKDVENKTFTAVPFYALANREKSKQVVWVQQAGKQETSNGWGNMLYRPLSSATLSAR